jgi:aerotaxis receptor
MRKLLHDELKSRDASLARERLALFPAMLSGGDVADVQRETLRVIYAESQKAYQEINTLYEQLDDLGSLNGELAAKAQMVLQQTKDFRFIAFNAALRAARLGEEARSLGVIADYLGEACGRTATIVAALGERIMEISRRADAVTFNLAAARLQIEMLLSFCAELAASLAIDAGATTGVPHEVRRAMIESLQLAFASTVDSGVRMLLELESDLLSLGGDSEDLRKTVLTLQVAQVGGLVEATRLVNDDSFAVMFADLREGIERTKDALAALNEISDRMQAVARRTPAMAAVISAAVQQMSRDVHALSSIASEGRAEPKRVELAPAAELAAA